MSALRLASRLALARIRGRGGAALDMLGVLAFTVSTWLALTVAGGTWMFVQRAASPAPAGAIDPGNYIMLAIVACALLVAPILGLGGAAARLGARGRSRRLATLRLVGMTGPQVVGIAVVEALVQAAVGVAAGIGVYLLSLPAWTIVSFQAQHISAFEMLLPWWLLLVISAAMLVLAVLSTVMGLSRVRISPLGVARNEDPGALRAWRIGVFGALVLGFLVYAQSFDALQREIMGFVIIGGFIGAVVLAVNLIGPFILQLSARAAATRGGPATLLGARRIADDPKAAWRNVSGVALLSFVAAATAAMPSPGTHGLEAGSPDAVFFADLQTGVLITLLVALVVAASSTLISQASSVFDRAAESQALDRMGVERSLFAAVRRREVIAPLALALVVSIPLGFLIASPFLIGAMQPTSGGFAVLGIAAVAGLAMAVLAAEACRPLQAGVLAEQRRRND